MQINCSSAEPHTLWLGLTCSGQFPHKGKKTSLYVFPVSPENNSVPKVKKLARRKQTESKGWCMCMLAISITGFLYAPVWEYLWKEELKAQLFNPDHLCFYRGLGIHNRDNYLLEVCLLYLVQGQVSLATFREHNQMISVLFFFSFFFLTAAQMGTAKKKKKIKNNFCLKELLISGSLTTSAKVTGFIFNGN